MFKSIISISVVVFLLCTTLYGEENKERKDSGKVKTGVEVEKGNKAPDWETEILKKKKENKKEKKEELKKERKEEIKKERKERKLEHKKERSERKKQKGK
jgi:hypothetical protein